MNRPGFRWRSRHRRCRAKDLRGGSPGLVQPMNAATSASVEPTREPTSFCSSKTATSASSTPSPANSSAGSPSTPTRTTSHEAPHDKQPNPRSAGPAVADVLRHHKVGLTGFEPAASSSRTRRATKLRHSPMRTGWQCWAGPRPAQPYPSVGGASQSVQAGPGGGQVACRGASGACRGVSVSRVAWVGRRPGSGRTGWCRPRRGHAARRCRDHRRGSPRGGGAGLWRDRCRGRGW